MTIYSNDDMTYEFPSSGVCDGGGGGVSAPKLLSIGTALEYAVTILKKNILGGVILYSTLYNR